MFSKARLQPDSWCGESQSRRPTKTNGEAPEHRLLAATKVGRGVCLLATRKLPYIHVPHFGAPAVSGMTALKTKSGELTLQRRGSDIIPALEFRFADIVEPAVALPASVSGVGSASARRFTSLSIAPHEAPALALRRCGACATGRTSASLPTTAPGCSRWSAPRSEDRHGGNECVSSCRS